MGVGQLRVGSRLVVGYLRVCSQGRQAERVAVAVRGGDGRGHVIGVSLAGRSHRCDCCCRPQWGGGDRR